MIGDLTLFYKKINSNSAFAASVRRFIQLRAIEWDHIDAYAISYSNIRAVHIQSKLRIND